MGLNPGRVTISWLLLGWLTVHLSRYKYYITSAKVNSAFHPSKKGKLSTELADLIIFFRMLLLYNSAQCQSLITGVKAGGWQLALDV